MSYRALRDRPATLQRIKNGYRMTRLIKWIFVLVLIVGIAAAWVYADYRHFVETPLGLDGMERIIQVPEGASAATIVALLDEAHIVERRWMMTYVLRSSGFANRLQPGTVILTPDMTPADLPEVFARVGKYARLTVQILNGMNLYDIAERLRTQRVADEKVFHSRRGKSPCRCRLQPDRTSCNGSPLRRQKHDRRFQLR